MSVVDVLGFTGNAGPRGTLGDSADPNLARQFLGAADPKTKAATLAPTENLAAQAQYNQAKAEYDAWKMRHDASLDAAKRIFNAQQYGKK